MGTRTWWETIEVKSGELIDKIKEIIAEGNVRHIRIKQKGRVVAEFPLTAGLVGVVLAPIVAAIATISALLSECTIEVEKEANDDEPVAPVAGGTTSA